MKKRLFAIMLALAMLLAAVPALAEEGEVQEQDQVKEKILCATEGCKNEVANKGDFCKDCATAKKVAEEAAKKAEEEAAAKKAAEEEALRKAAEEEAAKKAAEEEALRKAAEEAAKKAAEGKTEGLKATPGETNQAGTGADGNCHHNHTAAWASTHPEVQGTMVEHPAVAATCTSEGNVKYYTCNKCGGYFVEDGGTIDIKNPKKVNENDVKTPKTKHTLIQIAAKAATCTEAGNIEYYECSACKGKFADSTGMHPVDNIVIPALGHTISENVTYKQKPTCTKAGIATYTCGRCGDSQNDVNVPAIGHDYGEPTWNWCGVSSATATFRCRRNCGEENAIVTCQARLTRSSINNCGYYTYTATVQFNGKTYTDMRTDYSCRPDWYYDPCYYNNPCGHWGCGNVCTRYSNCVPCQNYRTTFRVGGYNCLATPKTGDASVIAPAMLALIGAAGAMLGKKRR